MPAEKKSFINVDELMPQITVDDAARFYGVVLPSLHQVGNETRARCFLACGKSQETGDRALAIQHNHPARQWQCHQYGCGKNGNLVSMCDLLRPGDNAGGRPRGQRFKNIAADLKTMAEGGAGPGVSAASAPASPASPPGAGATEVKVNVPLAESPNERARALVDLDRKFSRDLAQLPPGASAYLRRRPFLLSEECRTTWRVGYLPRDTGDDKSGGTMRGKIVYPYFSETGELLTWFGRDPDFEKKHQTWQNTDKSEREPEKFHFVKGFHRGIELYGQHRLQEPDTLAKLKALGCLPLVEGPNDVINLATLGVPAIALCSNTITREQAAKTARLARETCGGVVLIFLDCDEKGEAGMKQCLGYLAQLTPVRLAWTSKMFGGRFVGRQPESLAEGEWQRIRSHILDGQNE